MNDAGAMAHCHCGDEAIVDAPDRLTGTTYGPVDRRGAAVIDRIIDHIEYTILTDVTAADRLTRDCAVRML